MGMHVHVLRHSWSLMTNLQMDIATVWLYVPLTLQVVWAISRQLGCGAFRCPNIPFVGNEILLLVCDYAPEWVNNVLKPTEHALDHSLDHVAKDCRTNCAISCCNCRKDWCAIITKQLHKLLVYFNITKQLHKLLVYFNITKQLHKLLV
jgi:hypothetical protein